MRVSSGRDFQSRVMGDGTATGAGTGLMRPADYIALSEDATAPADTDVALLGELVVATSAGLERAQATYAHTAGSTSYTLTKTFTLTGATARTIRKMAVFNQPAAGTMVFESAVPNPPTMQTNDQLTITETVNI